MKQSARIAAFDVLTRIWRDGAYTNIALQHALTNSSLDPRDRALCTEIVYGTVRRQLTIDAVIQPFLKRNLRDLDIDVRTALRMTVYQLAFLERIPAYAAIDEAVELVKRRVRPASGFVNGVLRNFHRETATVNERIESVVRQQKLSGTAAAALRLGYPTWIVKRLFDVYGAEPATAMLAASNEPALLTVRVNRLQATMDEVRASLLEDGADGIEQGSLFPSALHVDGRIDVESSTAYQNGSITVQDEGAMLIAPLLHPDVGMKILDMCSAPGGKTSHIAELQGDKGHIDAYDVYLQKVKTVQRTADRLHLSSIRPRLGDARAIAQEGQYDAVLLDAPCSGLGVMRRRPDIRHRRTESDIRELGSLQRELLRAACGCVRSGGVVVYSTCTLLPEENEQVVDDIVNELNGIVQPEDIGNELSKDRLQQRGSGVLLAPDVTGNDGFFMARLRKNRR